MSSPSVSPRDNERIARALGLKLPVYLHLKEAFERGEDPVWLRAGDPALAGMFPNAFGFEVLCERFHAEEALERRRANLLRQLEGKEMPEIETAVAQAMDEGELEDLSLALEPSSVPAQAEGEEVKEEQQIFLNALRGQVGLARDLRRLFREKCVVRVELLEGKGVDTKPYAQLAGLQEPLLSLPAQRYLHLRRGERAHALKLNFDFPVNELRSLFDQSVESVPPQEKESYLKLFLDFVERERAPRYAQEARARLKRNAENINLQQAWQQLESALDRGKHDGIVLGMCALRGNKLQLVLSDKEGNLLRTKTLPTKAEDLGTRVQEFIGTDAPTLVAVQADSPTRTASQKALEALKGESGRPRTALIPVAVVRTMLREVARRPGETHLTHDERQALLLARLAWYPRAAAYHTQHIVRAYIPYRGEINARRLEEFEHTFLRNMLLERGVDLNAGSRDQLRLVPGLDADAVLLERATAPFRSVADFQARMGLPEPVWRGVACFVRVREGEEPMDARGLHPVYYPLVKNLCAAKEIEPTALLKDPTQVAELDWNGVLEERRWPKAVVDRVRLGLSRSTRRPRRGGRAPVGQRLEALEVGQTLRGTVTTLLPYGAFVDVGARREGLVHISELADRFVKDPAEVVQVGQEVTVRVLSVDVENQRFRLSMRTESDRERREGDGEQEGRGGGRGGRRGERGSGGGGGGGRGGRGGRSDGRGGQGRGRGGRGGRGGDHRERDNFKIGPDPKAVKEEIDPTNPFFQFFQKHQVEGQDDKAAESEGGDA